MMIPTEPARPRGAAARGTVLNATTALKDNIAMPGPDSACQEAVEQALTAAIKDDERIVDLLDELSRGRLWLPLPDDEAPVTDGSSLNLPTVTYLGSAFVPAYTSAQRLASSAADQDEDSDLPPPIVPHVVVPVAELARQLPPSLGIALNPGAGASVPVYPEGVAYLAAAQSVTGGTRIRVGHPPAEPAGLLRVVRARLRGVPAARQASRAWLSVAGEGEGLIISVTLDDPADENAQQEVIAAVEQAAAVREDATFPIDVTFPGEGDPDPVDEWTAAHAAPFYQRT